MSKQFVKYYIAGTHFDTLTIMTAPIILPSMSGNTSNWRSTDISISFRPKTVNFPTPSVPTTLRVRRESLRLRFFPLFSFKHTWHCFPQKHLGLSRGITVIRQSRAISLCNFHPDTRRYAFIELHSLHLVAFFSSSHHSVTYKILLVFINGLRSQFLSKLIVYRVGYPRSPFPIRIAILR